MPYQGHCNCRSINVELKNGQQPPSSLLCYCRNCTRSGAGYSVNYVLNETDVEIQDPQSVLKTYTDTNTDSGNHVQRRFCGNCGSPVVTNSPHFPGKTLVKASLFDRMAGPDMEVFTARREDWQPAIHGAKQG